MKNRLTPLDYRALTDRGSRLLRSNPELPRFLTTKKVEKYPSVEPTVCCTTKKATPQYTGTYVTGIATMHKSNAIPVTSPEQAVDLARMRR